jgi:hypothetical protein
MKRERIFLLFLLAFLFTSCNYLNQNNQTDSCPLPPSSFTSKDLIGTWKAGIPESNDTLIIKEDGTYKQIIHVDTPLFDYESDWLPWSKTVSDQGIPYLHLEGMRLCVYWVGVDCQLSGGGQDSWYDFCKKEWVQIPGEGILLVLGPPKDIKLQPPEISLFALQRSTEGTSVYNLQRR